MSLKISVGAVFATAPLRMGEEKDHAKTVCSLYKLFNALQVVTNYEVLRHIASYIEFEIFEFTQTDIWVKVWLKIKTKFILFKSGVDMLPYIKQNLVKTSLLPLMNKFEVQLLG